jgi:hypothetical protein
MTEVTYRPALILETSLPNLDRALSETQSLYIMTFNCRLDLLCLLNVFGFAGKEIQNLGPWSKPP